jgi:hypothetical protein
MSRFDGHQYDQEARVQEQGVGPLLAGPKTGFLREGRAHHRIHHRLRVSEGGLVDLLGPVGAKQAYRQEQGEPEQHVAQEAADEACQ